MKQRNKKEAQSNKVRHRPLFLLTFLTIQPSLIFAARNTSLFAVFFRFLGKPTAGKNKPYRPAYSLLLFHHSSPINLIRVNSCNSWATFFIHFSPPLPIIFTRQ